jgi:hypothetical protein
MEAFASAEAHATADMALGIGANCWHDRVLWRN